MTLWWIANVLLLLIVVPVLVALLSRVLGALEGIRGATEGIRAAAQDLNAELAEVPDALHETDRTIAAVSSGAVRYAGSVGTLLGD